MRKKAKKTKESGETSINIPGNISWNMGPPNSQTASQQKGAKCKEYDCEVHKLVGLIADIATGIWRMKKKFSAVKIDDMQDDIKKAYRHVESTWDTLYSANVKVRNHTNEKYVDGMALKVIAFQPSSLVNIKTITETIKPSIFYKDKLIQMGEVIVETPNVIEFKKNGNIENASDKKERNKE